VVRARTYESGSVNVRESEKSVGAWGRAEATDHALTSHLRVDVYLPPSRDVGFGECGHATLDGVAAGDS